MDRKKNILVHICTLVLACALIVLGRAVATKDERPAPFTSQYETCRAQVESVAPSETHERFFDGDVYAPQAVVEVTFNARITSGEHKGETVTAVQQMEEYYSTNRKYVEEGDKVLLINVADMDGDMQWTWLEYERTDVLLILGVILCIGMIIFGRAKGVNTLVAFCFTCLAIFYVFLPAILSGQSPYIWSILVCLFISSQTLLLVNGASKKSFVAGISCFAGTLASAFLMILMDRCFLHLTGMHNDESIYLLMLSAGNPIDVKGVVFAGVIIGAVGAIMDLAMSITSPLFELYDQTGGMSAGELIKSGLRIGQDYLSTMSNTLVLAYIGCEISLVLLLLASNTSTLEMMNREMLISEILQALLGIFGILLTVPISSVFCALSLCSGQKKTIAALRQEDNVLHRRKLVTRSNYDLSFPVDRHGLDSHPGEYR